MSTPAKPSRDPFEVFSPAEIGEHFIYVDKPVFHVADSLGFRTPHVVKTYFTKSTTWDDIWFRSDGSVNERERRRIAKEMIPYIKRWFSFYEHVWRGRAECYGPYVHSVRLCGSPIMDLHNRLKYLVTMRVAYAKIML